MLQELWAFLEILEKFCVYVFFSKAGEWEVFVNTQASAVAITTWLLSAWYIIASIVVYCVKTPTGSWRLRVIKKKQNISLIIILLINVEMIIFVCIWLHKNIIKLNLTWLFLFF